jgi:hypothetical protein
MRVRHAFQTAQPNNPAYDVSADAWNQDHEVTGSLTRSVIVTLIDGASVALDASLGDLFKLVAAGDRTISVPTNKPAAGQTQRIIIMHEASGGARTLSLTVGSAGAFKFGADIASLSVTASGTIDLIGCVYDPDIDRWLVVSISKGY